MYGLLVTFHTSIPVADLEASFTDYGHALQSVHGLLTKAWLGDGTTLGGFYLFATRDDADAYLGSDLVRGLVATDGFDDFETRGFDVFDEFCALTGITDLPALATA